MKRAASFSCNGKWKTFGINKIFGFCTNLLSVTYTFQDYDFFISVLFCCKFFSFFPFKYPNMNWQNWNVNLNILLIFLHSYCLYNLNLNHCFCRSKVVIFLASTLPKFRSVVPSKPNPFPLHLAFIILSRILLSSVLISSNKQIETDIPE